MGAKILDLFDSYRLFKLHEKVSKNDDCNFTKRVRAEEEALFAELTEEQIEKVKSLELAVRDHEEYISYEMQTYTLNLAFRVGMEMQQAFDKEDNEY